MKKKPTVNTSLRQWARGVSFTIAMGRRQVFTLVSIEASKDVQASLGVRMLIGDRHRQMCSFVTSARCLVDRGLVIPHVWLSETLRKESHKHKTSELWQLSRAGELVIELLKEAGIYQEVLEELHTADKVRLVG